MKFDLAAYLESLKRGSKKDLQPGYMQTDEDCPACGEKMVKYPACCSSPNPTLKCTCGYVVNLEEPNG